MQTLDSTHCSRFDTALRSEGPGRGREAVKVEPDREDPFSHGYSCPKGLASLERIHTRRASQATQAQGGGEAENGRPSPGRGAGASTKVYRDTMERHGPRPWPSPRGPKGLEFFVLLRLANLLRTPNVASYQHVCHMPGTDGHGHLRVFPVADLEHPTDALLLGEHPLHTNEEEFSRPCADCLKSSPALVVVTPSRRTWPGEPTSGLRIRPGRRSPGHGFLHISWRKPGRPRFCGKAHGRLRGSA